MSRAQRTRFVLVDLAMDGLAWEVEAKDQIMMWWDSSLPREASMNRCYSTMVGTTPRWISSFAPLPTETASCHLLSSGSNFGASLFTMARCQDPDECTFEYTKEAAWRRSQNRKSDGPPLKLTTLSQDGWLMGVLDSTITFHLLGSYFHIKCECFTRYNPAIKWPLYTMNWTWRRSYCKPYRLRINSHPRVLLSPLI